MLLAILYSMCSCDFGLVDSSSAETNYALPAGRAGGLMPAPGAGSTLATMPARPAPHAVAWQRGQPVPSAVVQESLGHPGSAGAGGARSGAAAGRWQPGHALPAQPGQARASMIGQERAAPDTLRRHDGSWRQGQQLPPVPQAGHEQPPVWHHAADAYKVGAATAFCSM